MERAGESLDKTEYGYNLRHPFARKRSGGSGKESPCPACVS